jgi:hypothetical protein
MTCFTVKLGRLGQACRSSSVTEAQVDTAK